MASEAYHDWSGEAAGARLRVNFMLKLLLSQNFCNRPLMRFISFASDIGPAAAVPAGPAPTPLLEHMQCCFCIVCNSAWHHAWLHGFFVCLLYLRMCVVVVVTCYYICQMRMVFTVPLYTQNCFETIYKCYYKECVCSIDSCPEDSSTLPAQSFR